MTRSPAFSHRLLSAFLRRGALPSHLAADLAHLSDQTLRDIGIEPDQVRRRTRRSDGSPPVRMRLHLSPFAKRMITMTLSDSHGLVLTGASDVGRAAYEAALAELQCYRADPVATIDGAIAADPGFAMAHAMRAWLHLLGTEPAGFGVAEESHLRAAAAAATEREKGHVAAIGALISGRLARRGPHPRGRDARASARRTRAARRPPDRLLHRQRPDAARPHRPGDARLGCRSPRLPFAARHAGLRLGGDRRTTPPPSAPAGGASSSSRATAGRSTRSRM